MEIAEPFLKTCMEEANDYGYAEHKTKANKKIILIGKH